MGDHNTSVYNNSCLKLPRNPKNHNRPLPLYEQKYLNELKNEVTKKNAENTAKNLLEFYDSIPEYDEINHLSAEEFDRKLDGLREKQKLLRLQYLMTEGEDEAATTATRNSDDTEDWMTSEGSASPPKPSSRRSVRIESPPPRSPSESSRTARSAPATPTRTITIPQPFQMTVRDEENRIVDECLAKTRTDGKNEMFRAHPIPIESQIPLYDRLVEAQARKNRRVRERSRALLQAQMRPFSFTRRDEEVQELNRRLSKSSPSLTLPTESDDNLDKPKLFKAKPVPKNLFSNYVYRKMQEDEFYRNLQKKIRSEEMLRASSLPPSMAEREKTRPKYDVCPRSYRLATPDESVKLKRRELKPKIAHAGSLTDSESKSVSASASYIPNLNRSNLAAVLRIASARKRIDREMMQQLEEARLKQEARWKEKLMRKKPVWATLTYSQEEDLAMRLQLRRDEERLKMEEYRMRMQMMLGRVNRKPTLFEQQSQTKLPKQLYRPEAKRSISDLSYTCNEDEDED